MQGFLL